MSPLKADYFSSADRSKRNKTGSKLFSPESNYLRPDKSPSKKCIPSPVKFVSVEQEEDLSDLITALAKVNIWFSYDFKSTFYEES